MTKLSQQKCLALVLGLVVGVAWVGSAFAQAGDPHLGTWKVNVAKSTYSPGPAPKSATSKWEVAGNGMKTTVDSVGADGTAVHWEVTGAVDGKDYPITGNNPNADMAARKRIDANTIEIVYKKGGKVTTTNRSVISADGKTRTVTATGTDGQGRKVNNVQVYEKQASAT